MERAKCELMKPYAARDNKSYHNPSRCVLIHSTTPVVHGLYRGRATGERKLLQLCFPPVPAVCHSTSDPALA